MISMSDTAATAPTKWFRRLPGARQLQNGYVSYWWLEILMLALFYGTYSFIRNANGNDVQAAFENAKHVMQLQSMVGINHEATLQMWALHVRPLVIALNYFYGSFHFFVTIGVGIFLFIKWRNDYPRWRNTIAIATAVALIGFIFFPLMPPRLLDQYCTTCTYGFIDTMAKYPTFWSFNSGAVSRISNQYAAMPSVHCAWALWCACALYPRVKHIWAKVLAVVYPIVTVITIVLTANHYFLDAVAGFAVLGIAYLAARRMTRAGNAHRTAGATDSGLIPPPERIA
ncbi:MAG: phosphatase PAP2 family protein [Acidimicrobiia bacterium]